MQQLRAIPDIAGHILDLEAELSRLTAERDAATTKDVFEREDAAFRAVDSGRHDLLSTLSIEEHLALEVRATMPCGGPSNA